MLKSILLGLDGSPHSKVATEMGIRWAQRHDALLVGLGIVDEPGIRHSQPSSPSAADKARVDATRIHDAHRRVEQYLAQFTLRCAEARVACKVLQDVGVPASEIVLEAQRYDLVLLGRRTYFQTETENGPDATLFEVVKHSPRPVVTVPDSIREGKRILVGYDGSLPAARAVQAFVCSGLYGDAEVRVLSVAEEQLDASRQGERAADFLRHHGRQVEVLALRQKDQSIGEILIQHAWEADASLLVLGAHGQPRWREFVFGSVTLTVLKQTPVPLFLCL